MEPDVKQDSFGSYLKDSRIQREMAIETVAARTKITVNCLLSMEANALDRLPPPSYLKSFIRAYANTVGADADMAINLYLSNLEMRAATRQQRLKRQAKIGVIRRFLMAVGLIACVLLIVRYTDLFPEPEPVATTPSPNRPPVSAAENQASQRYLNDEKEAAKLKLRVVALEHTWLKIIVDDQNVRSYDLKPEDRLELEGTDHFNLMIGDANGLQIFFNDEPVKIFGSSGQVVNLKLP